MCRLSRSPPEPRRPGPRGSRAPPARQRGAPRGPNGATAQSSRVPRQRDHRARVASLTRAGSESRRRQARARPPQAPGLHTPPDGARTDAPQPHQPIWRVHGERNSPSRSRLRHPWRIGLGSRLSRRLIAGVHRPQEPRGPHRRSGPSSWPMHSTACEAPTRGSLMARGSPGCVLALRFRFWRPPISLQPRPPPAR